MTKRILVVLDPGHDTEIATRYAIELAKEHDAEITGLALVDRKRISEATQGGGIGSMYYAEKLKVKLTDEVRSEAQKLLKQFAERVDTAGAKHSEDHIAEAEVIKAITEDMKTHDLLVAGHESHFYYADPERRTHALAGIVEQSAAATLVVESEYRDIGRILVAYDGGSPAARALQKYVHLNLFGTDVDVEVLHVRGAGRENELEGERLIRGVSAYLQSHGFSSVKTSSIEDGHPMDRILAHSESCGADLIVAGAYSKSGLKKMFFGSTAEGLIENSPVPLFLYH